MTIKDCRNAVIIGSGENFSMEKLREDMYDKPVLICADGGLNRLKNTLYKPDYILGDFDSIDQKLLPDFPEAVIESYSSEKDDTDMELAIKKAVNLGCREIFLHGAVGSYLDHTLANILNLIRYGNSRTSITIRTDNSSLFVVNKYQEFVNNTGKRVSFIPIIPVRGLKMEGFQYRFKPVNLKAFEYGISNRIDRNPATIEFQRGKMLAVLYDQNYH